MVQSKCAEISHEEEEKKLRQKVNIIPTMCHLQFICMWNTLLFHTKNSHLIMCPWFIQRMHSIVLYNTYIESHKYDFQKDTSFQKLAPIIFFVAFQISSLEDELARLHGENEVLQHTAQDRNAELQIERQQVKVRFFNMYFPVWSVVCCEPFVQFKKWSSPFH